MAVSRLSSVCVVQSLIVTPTLTDKHAFDESVKWSKGGSVSAEEHLQTALRLLGRQHCLDFVESSDWPIRSHDLLANVNRSLRQAFDLAGVDVSESTRWTWASVHHISSPFC